MLGIGVGAMLARWPAIFAGMPRAWWLLETGCFPLMQAAMGAIIGAW